MDLGPPYFFLRSLQNRDFCVFLMKNRLIIENVAEISVEISVFMRAYPRPPIVALRSFITIGDVLADIQPLKVTSK